MKKIFLMVAVMCFTLASFAQSAGKIVVSQGDKFVINSKIESSTNVEAMGQQVEVKSDVDNKYQVDVDKIDDDGITVSGTIKAVKVNSSVMGQETTFDSEDTTATGPVADQIKNILDKPQTILLNNQGELVKSVDDLDDEIKQVVNQLGGSSGGPQTVFLVVPANVKVGESFEKNKDEGETGSKSKTTYTLKSLEGNMATLSFKSELTSNATIEQMGMEIATNMKGSSEGEMVVDVQSGVVKSSKSTTKMNGSSSVMGQDMPTSVEMTSESIVKKI